MGGEKWPQTTAWIWRLGSPPHGRGKAKEGLFVPCHDRITPAWAGKRRSRKRAKNRKQDHPRMGGEKLTLKSILTALPGSPPHGRGKASERLTGANYAMDHPRMGGEKEMELPYHENAWGSPPHGRGKGSSGDTKRRGRVDHPRMGGEKGSLREHDGSERGSPPHGRGKVFCMISFAVGVGITPAWAGKSLTL